VETRAALEAVLTASATVEAALEGDDCQALETALLGRAAALSDLMRSAEHEPISAGLEERAAEVLALDRRLRDAGARRLGELRGELLALGTGRRVLTGYAPRLRPAPRFADSKG
jgi:hypothetical protein